MRYNWQQSDWPAFRFDLQGLEAKLIGFAEQAGRASGLLAGLPSDLEAEAVLNLMIEEAVNSSAIEGEDLARDAVMSSIKNHLGLNPQFGEVRSRKADGAGQLMVAVRNSFAEPLTEETLFGWHRMLLEGTRGIHVGDWRTDPEPMQVISGAIHKPIVHFEAPPSSRVPEEMAAFLSWFNDTGPGGRSPIIHAPVRSAVAHLYFESIHPFDDGNGRIGRAISEKALSQGLGRPVLMSLSRTIEANKKAYYGGLMKAQSSNEVTKWVSYFLDTILQSQADAEAQIVFILNKTKFFQRFQAHFNERQLRMIRRVMDAGPGGFEGGINARKYVAVTGISKATATRDLQELSALGAIVAIGAGRSTRYELNLDL